MLTSTEPCEELRPMVTERFFMRYSNSRPSSRATAAAAVPAAILAETARGTEGPPSVPPPRARARPTPPTGPAPDTDRLSSRAPPCNPHSRSPALRRDGQLNHPMAALHAHGAIPDSPITRCAGTSAGQQDRLCRKRDRLVAWRWKNPEWISLGEGCGEPVPDSQTQYTTNRPPKFLTEVHNNFVHATKHKHTNDWGKSTHT